MRKMSSNVVSFIDVDTPGIIKTGSYKKSQTLSSSNYQVTFTLTLTCVAPALITSQPTIFLDAIINKSNGATVQSRNVTVSPSVPDAPPSGFYIDSNGDKQLLTTFVSNLNVFGIRAVSGDVYFSVPLMMGESFGGGVLRIP